MDLATAHAKLWRLRLSVELVWDAPEQQEPEAEPMGFGSSTVVEVPDLEDGEVEDRRLGFPG